MIFIFSIIAGLQCSVHFLLYNKVTQSHIHIYILFLTFSSIRLHHKWLDIVPSRISLLIHSKGNSLYLFTPDSQFIPLPPLPPWQPQLCSPCPWVSFLWKGLFVKYIRFQIYVISYMVCVFFWLISLSMRVSNSIHVAANGIYFVLFYGQVVFHCVYIPYLLNPLICQWTFRLFPCLDYCEYCCNEHSGACIFLSESSVQIYAQEWDCWVIW